uniref:Endonuclease domain-containing 1 protein n=1 Tax=Anas platyrhynchos TaxID=8839 RepID=A0A8B9TIC2_ANAPL
MPPLLLILLQISSSCLCSCPQFFFRETPPNDALEPENPAWICQRYENQYYFATLYDRSRRIPVYSAYLYQPGPGKRPKTWLVEPQLMGLSYPKTMEKEWTLLNYFNVTLEQLGKSQAVLQDYKNLTGLNRGHLNPSGHHSDSFSRLATFSLTNIIPQDEKLNGGAWNNYEQQIMMRRTQSCNTTYIRGGRRAREQLHRQGQGQQAQPHLVECLLLRWTTTTGNLGLSLLRMTRTRSICSQLGELEEVLTQLYGRDQVYLFDSDCPRE